MSAKEKHGNAQALASNAILLRRISTAGRPSGIADVPAVGLRFAPEPVHNIQTLEERATGWVAPPDWIRPRTALFVAQAIADSMSRRIPNGTWCPFGGNSSTPRQGKVVEVRQCDLADPDTGDKYTVKLDASEKVPGEGDGRKHARITLSPDFDQQDFEPGVLRVGVNQEGFAVWAEVLLVQESTYG